MAEGLADKMIRVDMATQTATVEPFPAKWRLLGGRALSARILLEECDPKCEPLGAGNVLVIAPGVLAGTSAPTSGRISIGAQEPADRRHQGSQRRRQPRPGSPEARLPRVIVTGKPADPNQRYGLEVDASGARVVAADPFKGLWNYAACEKLYEKYPQSASFISIGPAGEMQLSGASVACTDEKGRPARHAARGGLGAVMGSKGLKFVSVDAASSPSAAGGAQGLLRVLEGVHQGVPGRTADVQDGHLLGRADREHAEHLPVQEPHGRPVAGRGEPRRRPHRRELRDARRRHAQLHDRLHRAVFERRPRQGRQLQDQRARVRDADDARRQLRHRQLGRRRRSRPPLRRSRPRHHRSWRRDRDLHGLGRHGVRRRGGRQGSAPRDRRRHGTRQGARQWRGRDRQEAQARAHPGREGPGDPGVGSAAAEGDRRHLRHQPDGRRSHRRPDREPGPAARSVRAASQESQLANAACDSSGFCQFLQPTIEEIAKYYSMFVGEDVTREQIGDMAWQCLADEWKFNDGAGFTRPTTCCPRA